MIRRVESAQDRVTVTVAPTKAEVTAALTAWPWLHLVRLRRALVVIGVTVAVLALLDLVAGGRAATSRPMLVLCGVYLALVVGSPWLLGRRALDGAGVGGRVAWTFDATGVTSVTPKGENHAPWHRVTHVRRTPAVVAFLLRPHHTATGLRSDALDDAQYERILAWWRAGASGPTPGSGAVAGPVPEADDAWAGAAWTDEVVVAAPMTLGLVRRMNLFALPRRTVAVAALATVLLAVGPLLRLVLDPGGFGAPDARVLAGSAVPALALLGTYELAFRRVVRRLAGGPTVFRATPQGLSMQTPLGRSSVPWTRVRAAREAGGALVVRTDRPICPMGLPTTELAADSRALVAQWLERGTGGRVVLAGSGGE